GGPRPGGGARRPPGGPGGGAAGAAPPARPVVGVFILPRSPGRPPASTTCRTCSTVVHSTSMGTSGYSRRTAANAAVTPPAASTWLSLTSAWSASDIRWFSPPPQRTAYFSSARSPGVVFL